MGRSVDMETPQSGAPIGFPHAELTTRIRDLEDSLAHLKARHDKLAEDQTATTRPLSVVAMGITLAGFVGFFFLVAAFTIACSNTVEIEDMRHNARHQKHLFEHVEDQVDILWSHHASTCIELYIEQTLGNQTTPTWATQAEYISYIGDLHDIAFEACTSDIDAYRSV